MPATSHPLDIEIVGLADGALAPESAAPVEAHIADCLLCRIKRQRITGHPPWSPPSADQLAVPDFNLIETRNEDPSRATPGDLWVTAEPDGLMVLVCSVSAEDVIVVPVVVDVEITDEECLVVPADVSPLGTAISVYRRLRVNVPTRALARKVEVAPLDPSGTDGAYPGPAIALQSDPRLEVRQWLTDQLLALQAGVA